MAPRRAVPVIREIPDALVVNGGDDVGEAYQTDSYIDATVPPRPLGGPGGGSPHFCWAHGIAAFRAEYANKGAQAWVTLKGSGTHVCVFHVRLQAYVPNPDPRSSGEFSPMLTISLTAHNSVNYRLHCAGRKEGHVFIHPLWKGGVQCQDVCGLAPLDTLEDGEIALQQAEIILGKRSRLDPLYERLQRDRAVFAHSESRTGAAAAGERWP